jgi:hypothetical protein
MHLPGRLSSSTLGDLLGSLHRARITGTVELAEVATVGSGGVPGRIHRLHLRGGLVIGVETSLPVARVGDVRAGLDALFSLADARVAFRTARPLSSLATVSPLGPAEFLHGRPRSRDRGAPDSARGEQPPRSQPRPVADDPADRARALLGVPKGAAAGDVRRAFRRMAGALHPDRLAALGADERARMTARFAELSAAYHLLVA